MSLLYTATDDGTNWTKLMLIVKETDIELYKIRLISKLDLYQSVKIRLDYGETRSLKIGRRFGKGCCLSLIPLNVRSEWLDNEALEGLDTSN